MVLNVCNKENCTELACIWNVLLRISTERKFTLLNQTIQNKNQTGNPNVLQ